MAAAAPPDRRARPPPVSEIKTRPENVISKAGTIGQRITLKSNYFKLTSKTDWCLYQYRVDIAPNEERTIVRKALLRTHKATLGAYLFDGTVLYTSNRLQNPLELNSIRQEDRQAMNIKIRLVGDVVKGDYHYFQFFNIMVRKCLENLNLQLVGRNYYDAAARIEVSQFRLELWPGYVTSIRQHEKDVLMCTEISHKVMRNQTLYDVLRDCHERQRNNYQTAFSKAVIGSVVLTDYNNRTYKVDDVDYKNNPSSTFKLRDGTQISYETYYKQKYQIKIRDSKQPLLVSISKARDRRAGVDEFIYLVPELCRSTGLTDDMRSNFQLMKALAVHTRINPESRIQRLLAFNNRLKSNAEIVKDFKEWNFGLDTKLVELPARILNPEQIVFNGKMVPVKPNADWTVAVQTGIPIVSSTLQDWIALVPSRNEGQVKTFIQMMKTVASAMKFNISLPRLITLDNDRADQYAKALTALTDKSTPRLVFCVVPNNNLDRYKAIKKILCAERGIPSQVVLARTLVQKSEANTRSVATKVAVQLNCKLGGVPWSVKLDKLQNSMVVGFDVCHDKNGDYGALVASLDRNLGRYYSAVSTQAAGEELSNNFAQLLGNAIVEYRKVNNCYPERIIIYRDGVGEGQIPFVHSYEISQIKRQLSRIYGEGKKFKFAFIIVTKRLNTRFFYGTRNPPPGTVIDDVITDPLKYDFFIVSQSVNQGTVAPTAYNVIEDSTGFKPDQMQEITYKLCHLYFNFSGTVRVPAPCQYAHKLAFFVTQTIRSPAHPRLATTLFFL